MYAHLNRVIPFMELCKDQRSHTSGKQKCNYTQISSLLAYTPDIYIVPHQLIKTGKEGEERRRRLRESKFIFSKVKFNQAAFRKSELKVQFAFYFICKLLNRGFAERNNSGSLSV